MFLTWYYHLKFWCCSSYGHEVDI